MGQFIITGVKFFSMRITKQSRNATLFSSLQKNSLYDQPIRVKNEIVKILTGFYLDRQELGYLLYRSSQSLYDPSYSISLTKSVDETTVMVAPLTSAFKEELAAAHARFFQKSSSDAREAKHNISKSQQICSSP